MIQRTPSLLLALALLCLPACSSNEGSSVARTSAPTARNTSTGTTDQGSRFLRTTGAVGAIAVESSPLEGRYVAVPSSRSLPTSRLGQQPPAPPSAGPLPPPNVYPVPPAPRLPVTDR